MSVPEKYDGKEVMLGLKGGLFVSEIQINFIHSPPFLLLQCTFQDES